MKAREQPVRKDARGAPAAPAEKAADSNPQCKGEQDPAPIDPMTDNRKGVIFSGRGETARAEVGTAIVNRGQITLRYCLVPADNLFKIYHSRSAECSHLHFRQNVFFSGTLPAGRATSDSS